MSEQSYKTDGNVAFVANRGENYKAVIHLASMFLFIFTSYRSLEVIQSSLNVEEGLGTLSLSVLYSAYGISCVSIGPIIVSVVKPKWALFVGCVGHILYIFINIWPMWITFICSSVLLGLISPLMWITQGIFITNLALSHTQQNECSFEDILSRFVSIFNAIFGLTDLLGNLV